MGAIVELIITAHGDDKGGDLGEAIGEQMVALNLRWWDDSDATCERVLAWLRDSESTPPYDLQVNDHTVNTAARG